MALTDFQRTIAGLLAQSRRSSGESYVAGGAALNTLLAAPRYSEDVDIFHDSEEAVQLVTASDVAILLSAGFEVETLRNSSTFVEVRVSSEDEATRLQWAFDSAFRFYPLQEHSELGLTMHPFDLATNKVLALIGRAVARDWIDIIECESRLQPLGYLVWAASGKDPGLNPTFILEQAARSARYTEVELAHLEFEGPRPSAAALSIEFRRMMAEAREVVAALPWQEVGKCVLTPEGELLKLTGDKLPSALAAGEVRFHEGALYGAYPKIV